MRLGHSIGLFANQSLFSWADSIRTILDTYVLTSCDLRDWGLPEIWVIAHEVYMGCKLGND